MICQRGFIDSNFTYLVSVGWVERIHHRSTDDPPEEMQKGVTESTLSLRCLSHVISALRAWVLDVQQQLSDQNLHVWIDWFSEFLQALVRFTPEVLQDVFKVVFFTEIKL